MKFLTKHTHKITSLALLAISEELYESPSWAMIRAYNDILGNADIAKSSEIIILQNDEEQYIGTVFFNDKYADYNYCGVNTMMYIRPEFRKKGYATELVKKLNKRLNSRHFDGNLTTGQGINGSSVFWNKMGRLNKTDHNCRKVQCF